jgi:hypothetical protein
VRTRVVEERRAVQLQSWRPARAFPRRSARDRGRCGEQGGRSAGICVAGQEHACRERLELRAVRVFVYAAVMWSAVASLRTLSSRLAVAVGSEPESALSTVITDYYLVLWIIDFIIIRLFRFVDMQFS